VRLHSSLGDHHLRGDLRVGKAAGDQSEYVEFALCELRQLCWDARGCDRLGEPLYQTLGDGRLDERVAGGRGADGGDEAGRARKPVRTSSWSSAMRTLITRSLCPPRARSGSSLRMTRGVRIILDADAADGVRLGLW
jgi:hypothetical protein